MITDAILGIFGNMIIGLVSLLPNVSTDPGWLESAWTTFSSFFGGLIYALNGSPDLGTNLAIALILFLTFEVGYFIWWITKIIVNWVRGAGA